MRRDICFDDLARTEWDMHEMDSPREKTSASHLKVLLGVRKGRFDCIIRVTSNCIDTQFYRLYLPTSVPITVAVLPKVSDISLTFFS